MIKQIREKLDSSMGRKEISAWQIRWSQKKSHQSFIALTNLECRRQVETESCVISIHKKKPSETLGLFTFKITPANLANFDNELKQALFAAGLVNNQPFELPEKPGELPTVEIRDASVDESTPAKCEERLHAAVAREKGIRLSAAEFFADIIETRLINHKGLDVAQEETFLQTEFILLAASATRENEYINRYTRRFVSDFDLEGEIEQSARFARDATVATLPKTGHFPVMLSDEPLDQLFNPLIARASARLKFNKMMNMVVGGNVVDNGRPKGDTITLWSNGLVDRAVGSNRFDSYGTPLGRVPLIENNILKNYLADKRYADYLSVPVTGELGNIEVAEGSTPFDVLLDPSRQAGLIYHLQAFSAFEPNAITGAFSAEIRAGYEISASGVKPIKGGSVSGVLQRDLLDCYLSKDRVQRERALVPQGLLFSRLTIAGS